MAVKQTISNGVYPSVQWVVCDFRNRLRIFAPLYIPVTLRTFFGARPARLVLSLQQHSLQVPHLDGMRDLFPTSQRAVSLGVMATEVELDPGICKLKHNNHRPFVSDSQLLAGLHMLAALWPKSFNLFFDQGVLQLRNSAVRKSGTIRCFWIPLLLKRRNGGFGSPFVEVVNW